MPEVIAPAPRPTAEPALPIAALVLLPLAFNPPPIFFPKLAFSSFVSFFSVIFSSAFGATFFLGFSLSLDRGLKTISRLLSFFSLYSLRA